jgi:peptide/nickel transport system ATP-binding protein
VLASGAAEAAGVAERCRTVDLPVLGAEDDAQVACHYALRAPADL